MQVRHAAAAAAAARCSRAAIAVQSSPMCQQRWIKWFNAWPVNVETLSELFDFNHAPFFQSFVEVRVERSRRRLVLALIGVQGPLHWCDLEIAGAVIPSGTGPKDPVEFVVQMK